MDINKDYIFSLKESDKHSLYVTWTNPLKDNILEDTSTGTIRAHHFKSDQVKIVKNFDAAIDWLERAEYSLKQREAASN